MLYGWQLRRLCWSFLYPFYGVYSWLFTELVATASKPRLRNVDRLKPQPRAAGHSQSAARVGGLLSARRTTSATVFSVIPRVLQ